MKIAVIYNRESTKVINIFGTRSREKYGLKSIQRIATALKKGGHTVVTFEGDKDLISNLESFMPRVLKGENPGMAFNLSYGIQGQARYTHVPGILEMVGIPYVGSGPLAHSLSLDKVVAKMLFVQNGIPTPEFAVLEDPEFAMPDLAFPLIVKPKNEAVSFGIRVVHDEGELREAADAIFKEYDQSVLVERFIDGREINVGVLGNGTPEALPPAELIFAEGPRVYTEADKKGTGGVRRVSVKCPADLSPELDERARAIAVKAFTTLGLYDCARVDMRLDSDDNLYVLETNSLPSLGEHGSYTQAAAAVGLDFAQLVNRLVDVASARYFGTPAPTRIAAGKQSDLFNAVTQRRDRIEKRVQELVGMSGRTSDTIGTRAVAESVGARLEDAGLTLRQDVSDGRSVWVWETKASLRGGTLIAAHVDAPLPDEVAHAPFRRDPEWLYGEAVASSRAPLACIEYALRSIRAKELRGLRLGVLLYADEGLHCHYSARTIEKVAGEAARMLTMRPGNAGDMAIHSRRGQRRYRLRIEGAPRRLGVISKKSGPLAWLFAKAPELIALTSKKQRISVDVTDVRTHSLPLTAPHQVDATVTVTFPEASVADAMEEKVRGVLGKGSVRWSFERIADRPAMPESAGGAKLISRFTEVSENWELPFGAEASVWPSVAGLAPEHTAALCGLGPVGQGLYTGSEAVSRVSLVQRTLLLGAYLTALGEA